MKLPKNNLPLGRQGEETAVKFLSSSGFKIIERNFKKRYGEIDVVAIEGKTLVFVEVKARKDETFGSPEEAITPWKLKNLIKSAYYYKSLHPKLPDEMRIDLVAINLSSGNKIERIAHYRNISQ